MWLFKKKFKKDSCFLYTCFSHFSDLDVRVIAYFVLHLHPHPLRETWEDLLPVVCLLDEPKRELTLLW